ncbi:MAG: NAD(P)-binding protein [Chloroflexi bacterium]|nr:NAD(P)-binding protein [Chloroflexota bacterium]
MPDNGEIKILGAGISGLSAAINLVRNGYRVTAFERQPDCGRRFHGDLEGIENWTSKADALEELASMNIKVNFACHPFSSMWLSNGYEMLNFRFKRPLFYLVRRGDMEDSLDQGLKRQALELGVDIKFNSSTEEADIIATGPVPQRIAMVDRGIVFETGMDDFALALVNDAVAPRGYSYLVVSKGYGCMAVVLFDRLASANVCFAKARQVIGRLVDIDIKREKPFGGVGTFSLQSRLSKGKSIYAGEAAGFQDCVLGFGIRYAVTSGFLSARSIVDGDDYPALVKEKIEPLLMASGVARFLWERAGWGHYRCLLALTKRVKEPVNILHRACNFSPVHGMLFPLVRFMLNRRYKGLPM